MDETNFLAEQFEEHRRHLRAVGYRMLGSLSEADDAVQEAWLRLSRSDADEIENLGGWLTTVIARVCLDMLRSRQDPSRGAVRRPRARPDREPGRARPTPSSRRVLADSVGLALLVVLDTLAPAERLAFVLHDMFAVPFEEIATDRRSHPERDPAARQPGPPPGAGRRAGARCRPGPPARGRRRVPRRRPAAATSTRWSRCSIPTSSCGPTTARDTSVLVRGAEEVAGRAMTSPGPRPWCGGCWSTARRVSSPPRAGGRSRSWPSPSSAAGSSRSTC